MSKDSRIADSYVEIIPVKGETNIKLTDETWDAILSAVKRSQEESNRGKSRIADSYVSVNIHTKDNETAEATLAKINDYLK